MNSKKTFWLILGSVVFLMALAVATFLTLNRYMDGETEKDVQEIARVHLQGVANEEVNRFNAVKKIRFAQVDDIEAEVRAMTAPDAAAVAETIRRNAAYQQLVSCVLVSESGRFVDVAGEPMIAYDDAEQLADRLRAGESVVSGGYAEMQQVIIYAVPISVPMEDGERSIGLLCMRPMDSFTEMMNLAGGDTLVSFQVLREDGSYLIRNSESVGNTAYDHMKMHMAAADASIDVKVRELKSVIGHDENYMLHVVHTDEDDVSENRSIYGTVLPESDFYLLTTMPYGVLDQTIEDMGRSRTNGMMFAIAALAIGILLVFFLYMSLSRQHIRAAEDARRIAEDASTRAEEEAEDAMRAREVAEDAMVELETAKDEAVRARDEAEKASRAKSEFLSNMSHDIRTPINGIMGMTGIALSHLEDRSRVRDCLTKIDGSSKHLLSLVNDVLDMSRIESGKVTANHAPFDMRTLIDNCASIVQGQLAGRDIRLIAEHDGLTHTHLIGDELHLRQIFINILGNSVKFTHDGDSITIRARELSCDGHTAHYRFELEDTGIGISQEFLPKLFDSFSQEAGGSRTTYKGTGLGMAITKQLIELLGGTVTVWSELNVGTRFTIDMPFEVNEAGEETPVSETGGSVDLHGMTILVAEDNEINMEIATMVLEESGATVVQAANGRLAVEAFAASGPGDIDAILMDLMMPEMGGIEAALAIRAMDRPDAADVPIIAATANAYQEDVDKVLAAGMNAHVAKPLEVDKLLRLLAELSG